MQLSVDGVSLAYGGRPVLSEVGFTLQPRSRTLLLGPSGSGKSSLLNIVCGLRRPDAGQAMLGDRTVAAAQGAPGGDEVRRRSMGIVFQTLRLVSALSLRENLLLAQKLQNGAHDRALIDGTLDTLGIAHRADARPHQLSQGEAQRAAIARALVVRPALLIADEPTSALDSANARVVADLLLDLAAEAGATLLVATHDERLGAGFERALMLEGGRIAA
ncbi:MAG: ATP-binding cassette domain-containing protein [Erythrobacter sp.]|jgi:ABC-type lipoprotein export system ATPase subunit|nr:ATP-binding cassette domain-containing protein [Erythrobacter sp.]